MSACKADPIVTRCHGSLPCADPSAPNCGPALVGVYGPDLYWGLQSDVDSHLVDLDAWASLSRSASSGHSIAGDFKDIEDPAPSYNVPVPLEMLWTNGYADFLNMTTTRKAAAIANGCCDGAIAAWADAYAGWVARGGNRRAFIAPLQEMNGPLTPYGLEPVNYRRAYERIQNIFAQHGVTREQIWWVFAPIGWTRPGDPPLSEYYPGDDKVDVIAFSAYNFGQCDAAGFKAWQGPEVVFGPYIDIIRAELSSHKPIFVAQTGSTSVGGDKDQWLRDSYTYLTKQNVRGILYFNGDKECDWAVYDPNGRKLESYSAVVSGPNFPYVMPSSLATLIRDQP
jgi:hypothetical protein